MKQIILCAVLLAVTLLIWHSTVEAQSDPAVQGINDIGRYQIVQVSERVDRFLVDTVTGDTWQWECPPESRQRGSLGITTCSTDKAWIFRSKQ